MPQKATEIRACPACRCLVAERNEPLSERDDFVRCPWCAALFWFKKADLAADVAGGEWRDEALLADLFDRTRIAQAATVREVFDALFPPIPERPDTWLKRAREHAMEVKKTMHWQYERYAADVQPKADCAPMTVPIWLTFLRFFLSSR